MFAGIGWRTGGPGFKRKFANESLRKSAESEDRHNWPRSGTAKGFRRLVMMWNGLSIWV